MSQRNWTLADHQHHARRSSPPGRTPRRMDSTQCVECCAWNFTLYWPWPGAVARTGLFELPALGLALQNLFQSPGETAAASSACIITRSSESNRGLALRGRSGIHVDVAASFLSARSAARCEIAWSVIRRLSSAAGFSNHADEIAGLGVCLTPRALLSDTRPSCAGHRPKSNSRHNTTRLRRGDGARADDLGRRPRYTRRCAEERS